MEQFFSIFDKKAATYMRPFLCKHVSEATRSIQMAIEEKNSPISKWPADFVLYLVGSFDSSTGEFIDTQSGRPEVVIEVAALVPKERMVSNA